MEGISELLIPYPHRASIEVTRQLQNQVCKVHRPTRNAELSEA